MLDPAFTAHMYQQHYLATAHLHPHHAYAAPAQPTPLVPDAAAQAAAATAAAAAHPNPHAPAAATGTLPCAGAACLMSYPYLPYMPHPAAALHAQPSPPPPLAQPPPPPMDPLAVEAAAAAVTAVTAAAAAAGPCERAQAATPPCDEQQGGKQSSAEPYGTGLAAGEQGAGTLGAEGSPSAALQGLQARREQCEAQGAAPAGASLHEGPNAVAAAAVAAATMSSGDPESAAAGGAGGPRIASGGSKEGASASPGAGGSGGGNSSTNGKGRAWTEEEGRLLGKRCLALRLSSSLRSLRTVSYPLSVVPCFGCCIRSPRVLLWLSTTPRREHGVAYSITCQRSSTRGLCAVLVGPG